MVILGARVGSLSSPFIAMLDTYGAVFPLSQFAYGISYSQINLKTLEKKSRIFTFLINQISPFIKHEEL